MRTRFPAHLPQDRLDLFPSKRLTFQFSGHFVHVCVCPAVGSFEHTFVVHFHPEEEIYHAPGAEVQLLLGVVSVSNGTLPLNECSCIDGWYAPNYLIFVVTDVDTLSSDLTVESEQHGLSKCVLGLIVDPDLALHQPISICWVTATLVIKSLDPLQHIVRYRLRTSLGSTYRVRLASVERGATPLQIETRIHVFDDP